MQLTIERSALLKALGHVQSVVERRNTIPILSNVLLSAGRDRLSFAATDLDMEMVDEAEAQVQVEGQITAPAHTLYEIVRKLPEGAEHGTFFGAQGRHRALRVHQAERLAQLLAAAQINLDRLVGDALLGQQDAGAAWAGGGGAVVEGDHG